MAKETYWQRFGFKKLIKISFGLATALFLLWLIFNSFAFVPEGQESKYVLTFLSYGVLGAFIFANADIRNVLFQTPFFKSIPRYLGWFCVSLVGFYILLKVVDPFPQVVSSILVGVPLYLLCIHAFVYATIESSFFQYYLDSKIGIFGSSITAGLFHMFIWSGDPASNFLGASLLFLGFSTFHFYTRKNKKDLIPVIANHTAYNFVKLSLILSLVA